MTTFQKYLLYPKMNETVLYVNRLCCKLFCTYKYAMKI